MEELSSRKPAIGIGEQLSTSKKAEVILYITCKGIMNYYTCEL